MATYILSFLLLIQRTVMAQMTIDDFNGAFAAAAYCKKTVGLSDGFASGDGAPLSGAPPATAQFVQWPKEKCNAGTAPGLEWQEKLATTAELQGKIDAAAIQAQSYADTIPPRPALYMIKVAHSVVVDARTLQTWAAHSYTGITFDSPIVATTPLPCSDTVPCNYFLSYLYQADVAKLVAGPEFEHVLPFPLELKMSPSLAIADAAAGVEEFSIYLAPASIRSLPEAEALAGAWQSALESVTACNAVAENCKFEAVSSDIIRVKQLPSAGKEEGLSIVEAQEQAQFLEPRSQFSFSSHSEPLPPDAVQRLRAHGRRLNKYASFFVQSGQAGSFPLWEHGITGMNQVVGVADSGLDELSCFFNDGDRPVTISRGAQPSSVNDFSHRKVVQYHAFADDTEGEDAGHGTHVSGSVAGHLSAAAMANPAFQSMGESRGIAYDAQIAFYDIGFAGAGNQTLSQQSLFLVLILPRSPSSFLGLDVPQSLDGQMFPSAYAAGARIHTNSWGASANVYDTMARSVDQFSWDQQDFLVLFAAGNDGASGEGVVA
jgi:subtilisin family serine protease